MAMRQSEFTLMFKAFTEQLPTVITLQAHDGTAWRDQVRWNNVDFAVNVTKAFSLYELAGTAKFSDGAVAAGIGRHRHTQSGGSVIVDLAGGGQTTVNGSAVYIQSGRILGPAPSLSQTEITI